MKVSREMFPQGLTLESQACMVTSMNTTTNTAPTITYSVEVTPLLEGLHVRYEMSVYAVRLAGTSGPVTQVHSCATLAEVDETLSLLGFARSEEFGPVCANGFATATVVLK